MDENGYVVVSSDTEEEVGQVHFQTKVFLLKCLLQLFQLRLSPSKAEKSNTSAKSLLGVTIKNTQTKQNLVPRDT